jgi:hypothetical protein
MSFCILDPLDTQFIGKSVKAHHFLRHPPSEALPAALNLNFFFLAAVEVACPKEVLRGCVDGLESKSIAKGSSKLAANLNNRADSTLISFCNSVNASAKIFCTWVSC